MEESSRYIFIWTIENFRVCRERNGICLESPAFKDESLDESTWCVQLYPNGRKETTKEHISCCLKRTDDSSGPDKVECDFSIEAMYGKTSFISSSVNEFQKGKSLGWEEFLEKDFIFKKNTHSSHDILTIKVAFGKESSKNFTQKNCWTKIVADCFSFKWIVKNSISSKADVKLVSFSENLQFEIRLEIPKDDVKISIRSRKQLGETQKLICCVTLVDLKGEEADSEESVLVSDVNDEWKFPTFLKRSKITAKNLKYLKSNCFTLKFDFTLSSGKRKEIECRSCDFSVTTKKDFSASLKTDLKRVFTDHVHTDVELHADEKVFRVHKVILCARSPVFLAMFNQDMVENQTGAINISDVEAGTLNILLEFMYTGESDIPDCESALKLLVVADKYQVLSLKEKCSSFLELLISDNNVCDILYTADLVQQEFLKVSAVNHVKENCKKIFKSKEWQHLVDNNLELATEVVSEVSTLLAV